MALFVLNTAVPKIGVDPCFDEYVESMSYRCDDFLNAEADRAADYIRAIVPGEGLKGAMAEWWKARREQFREELWKEYDPDGEDEETPWRTREDMEEENAALRKKILTMEAQLAAYKGIAREAGDEIDRLRQEAAVRESFIDSLLRSIRCVDCQRERGDWFR